MNIFLRELYDKNKKFWKKSKVGAEWIWRKEELESKLNANESVTNVLSSVVVLLLSIISQILSKIQKNHEMTVLLLFFHVLSVLHLQTSLFNPVPTAIHPSAFRANPCTTGAQTP